MDASPLTLFQVNEIELVFRHKGNPHDRPKVASSHSAYDLLISAWDMNKIDLVEQFNILLLDRNNACLGLSNISTGGVSACIVDPKIVFAVALKARAAGMILAHNHPSGNLNPSDADNQLTQRLIKGGQLLDVPILDHLIVSPRGYFSFTDNGFRV